VSEPNFRLLTTGELLDAVAGNVVEIRVLENAMMRTIAELERRGSTLPRAAVFTRMSWFVEEGQCLAFNA
jgi:hypothetical protein